MDIQELRWVKIRGRDIQRIPDHIDSVIYRERVGKSYRYALGERTTMGAMTLTTGTLYFFPDDYAVLSEISHDKQPPRHCRHCHH